MIKKYSNDDENLEEFLEFLASSFVDCESGNGGLAQVVPGSNVCVFAEVERGNFVTRNSGKE
jgi:hypothetical protein